MYLCLKLNKLWNLIVVDIFRFYFSLQSQRVHPYTKSFARPLSTAATPTASSPTSSQSFWQQSQPKPKSSLQQAAGTVPGPKNGQTPHGGLLPKRNGPIYGKTINRQQQQQQQHPQHNLPHNSPLQAASPPATISFLPPAQQKPQFYTSATVTTSHHLASIFHPPTCITTTTPTAVAATQATPSLGILHKKTDADPKYFQHSTFDSVRCRSTLADVADGRHPVSPNIIASRTPTAIVVDHTKNKHFRGNGDHEFATKPIGAHKTGSPLVKSINPPTPLYRKNSISSTCSSSSSSSPPSSTSFGCSSHLDSLPSSATDALFANPIKVEVKLEATEASCHDSSEELKFAASSSAVVGRSKRSYSESSHHEALQRIPAKQMKFDDSAEEDTKPDLKTLNLQEPKVVVLYVPERNRPIESTSTPLDVQKCWFVNEDQFTSREQRLNHKLVLLKRQFLQHASAQKFRSIAMARKRIQVIRKVLQSGSGQLYKLVDLFVDFVFNFVSDLSFYYTAKHHP